MQRRISQVAIVGTIVAALAYYAYTNHKNTLAEQAKLQTDMAVSVLPPGTQQAWIAYVDRRVADSIQTRSGSLLIKGMSDSAMRQATIVSRNTPYRLTCSTILGSSVEFGYGESAVIVPIYGAMLFGPATEKPPELGVIRSSVAATELSRFLCDHISARLDVLLSK